MFDRDNLIGLIFLALCAVVAGVLLFSIGTGTRIRYNGPGWLTAVVAVLFIGGMIYGLVSANRGRWPDPMTGRGRRWRWPWRRDRDRG